MFPKTFLVNNKDIIIETGNSYRVYSTIADFKRSKLIFINNTNAFYEKTSLKIRNAIIKKFEIKENEIFEIKTNLKEIKSKGRVKIEQVSFDLFLHKFFNNNLSQKIIKRLTNIKGVPANIAGIVSANNGITMMIFTDMSLPTDILKSLINELNPLNKFYLKNNYPFLNSITFISKKFHKRKLKVSDYKDIYLKHFKNSLNSIFENLIEIALRNNLKNEKLIKIEIALKSSNESLRLLNEMTKLDYIKSNLVNLDSIQNYYLLQKSLFNLFKGNLGFEINNVPVFDESTNIKDVLKQIRSILKSEEILNLKIFDTKLKYKKFYVKYTR